MEIQGAEQFCLILPDSGKLGTICQTLAESAIIPQDLPEFDIQLNFQKKKPWYSRLLMSFLEIFDKEWGFMTFHFSFHHKIVNNKFCADEECTGHVFNHRLSPRCCGKIQLTNRSSWSVYGLARYKVLFDDNVSIMSDDNMACLACRCSLVVARGTSRYCRVRVCLPLLKYDWITHVQPYWWKKDAAPVLILGITKNSSK